jgi:peptidoglycan hydrolase CwlO-like protein
LAYSISKNLTKVGVYQMSNETVTYSLEAVLTRIESKIDLLQRDVNQKIDTLQQDVNQKIDSLQRDVNERLTKLEIGQSEIKGDIKAIGEKINGLTARVAYQEFTNRGILIALVVAILAGAAKFFGFVKP